MYYKVTPSSGQSQIDSIYPETKSPERVDIYRTPEAKRLEELGQTVEWLRNAAVTTNNFNYDKVKQLGHQEDTITDGINKIIFGAKPNETISALEMTVMMLRAEAKLGGEFFGGDSKGVKREFFCTEPDKWAYFSSVKKPFKSEVSTMINYRISGQGIQKSFEKTRGTMTPDETRNLLTAAEGYTDLVGRTLYPDLYKYYKNWQDAQHVQQLQQQEIAAQAINQIDMGQSGDFASAA